VRVPVSHLLDVSFLIACGWRSHAEHEAARRWVERQRRFYTRPLTHLGFLRVIMSAAFRARFEDAMGGLQDLMRLKGARFVVDTLQGPVLPPLAAAHEVTGVHLVSLARATHLRPPSMTPCAAGHGRKGLR